jgi:hypothetical protein
MHVAGSMCTVKTFLFWADVPDTLDILLPDMLGDRRSRSNTLFFEAQLHWQGLCVEVCPALLIPYLDKRTVGTCS